MLLQLWVAADCSFLTFHIRSIFTVRFTTPLFQFHDPHECVITGLWAYCPCGSHSVISRLLAGGSLGFRIVLVLLPGSQISVWHCCGLIVCLFALPWPYQSLGDTMLSSFLVHSWCLWTDQLITSRAFFVLVSVLCCFSLFGSLVCFVCLFCCFRCLLSVLHGDSSMDYVSIQFSSLSNAHCLQDWCCHWSNSVNLQNAIVFPAW